MSDRHQLGDLQLAIMRVLWDQAEAAVTDVHEALSDRGLAPTTVATMLVKMEKKGVVAHRIDRRRYIYHPTVVESDVTRSMVGQLAERLFEGSAAAMVSHLIHGHEIDPNELEALKVLIEQKEAEERR